MSHFDDAQTKVYFDLRLKLVGYQGILFAILAGSLAVVNAVLIYMLKKHSKQSREKVNMIYFWSLTFTITYGLRCFYSYWYSGHEKFFQKFAGRITAVALDIVWDLPALIGTFVLNWKLL